MRYMVITHAKASGYELKHLMVAATIGSGQINTPGPLPIICMKASFMYHRQLEVPGRRKNEIKGTNRKRATYAGALCAERNGLNV